MRDAQIPQPAALDLKCTLRICLGDGICGAPKSLATDWMKVSLVTQLPANITQSAVFVTSCPGPASIALRNMNVPGRVLVITTTATTVQLGLATVPAVTQTVTQQPDQLTSDTASNVIVSSNAAPQLTPLSSLEAASSTMTTLTSRKAHQRYQCQDREQLHSQQTPSRHFPRQHNRVKSHQQKTNHQHRSDQLQRSTLERAIRMRHLCRADTTRKCTMTVLMSIRS